MGIMSAVIATEADVSPLAWPSVGTTNQISDNDVYPHLYL